ncbi:NADH-quinone oxidoreductase subunit NuoG [Neisseria chenwenguii]|uniref:NADH-quinone oxidoreductase n=1 Tax=Neisseria chenwenguii TaxID=1853278 RepID=A0A220S1C8_9NEIS|nr:NADH-quinone oxidoreductase subunit NuoG [Neisseria chenwenguii]ASK27247.1 NADH-quinone oxidoreductase subunit G [Neisseria chenwenguii]ROV54808.1 NADH-quinone oxidoreductase subunit G [Neisseria chenwenguii]
MLQIEIDGKQLAVKQGTTVIEAAHELGTYIPHFCYHKKLSIAANCRMCLVEVEKAPKPLPACATPVTDGMVVHTHSAKAKEAQEGVMEFLLINHPLDCPICDQGGECQLQDLAVGYGKSASRYTEEKRSVVGKDMGPLVSAAEMSRCIHCTRCVRFTEEIAGAQEIAMAGRGEHSEIMPFIGKVIETELSGNVIDLCPVGALTSKPFRFDSRTWELNRRKSVSAHDALGSNLIVQTKDHTVRRVLPLENEAINECWLSDRDRFAYEGLYHESRLKKPKIKQGGEWVDVDWKTALDYVRHTAECIAKEYGAEQIGIWANPMNTVEELYLAKKWAAGLGITATTARLREHDGRLSGSLKGAQWLGQTIEQLLSCDAVLIVGALLRKEQPLLTARLRRAAKNGMALSVLAANREELHMPLLTHEIIHPNQWVNYLNNVPEKVSGSLKNGERVAIILGADVQNHDDYAGIYVAAEKLAQEIGAILGVLPQAANSVGADVLDFNRANIADMVAQPKKAVVLLNIDPEIDVLGGAQAMAALQQAGSVMAFTVYESDALREVADVMLPIAPFTETAGSLINMEGRLQSFHGVVQGLGESRPLWKVLRVLGNLFGLDGFDFETSQDVLAEALGDVAMLPEKLNNDSSLTAQASQMQTMKGELVRVGGMGIYHTDPIVRRAASLQQTSHAAEPRAGVHPKTLANLGLADGEIVIATRQGNTAEIFVTIRADDTLPENVVFLPEHPINAPLGGMMNVIELRKAG